MYDAYIHTALEWTFQLRALEPMYFYSVVAVTRTITRSLMSCISSRKRIQQVLEDDYEKMVDNRLHCDIRIETANNRVVSAHRLFLCRSPYFKSMLTSGMKESSSGMIVFDTMNTEAVYQVLKFMYTDKNEIAPENCVGVLVYSLMFGLACLPTIAAMSYDTT
eukprot:GEZU01000641.1.p1 GENE.GEZU01000641.1~~GEZU01000641.1.p1  ORF type:complete len:163 (-),score=31.01 GEZU01000641.1:61-549(-)